MYVYDIKYIYMFICKSIYSYSLYRWPSRTLCPTIRSPTAQVTWLKA